MAPSPAEATNATPAANAGGIRVENCYAFKSRLQEYAQKADLPAPEYHTIKEGPSHELVFKSTVVVNGANYDSLPGFFTRKAAEQSAAEVALMEIVKSMPTNGSIPAVQETSLCKNLLQEYAEKMNYSIPSYIWTKQASAIAPSTCTIEIGGIQYIGAAARTKKEAEIKAARTALLAIQGQLEDRANGATKYIVVPGKRQVKETEKKPTATPNPLKVKKGGFKKKWNKRKFMNKNGQAVDVEKDEVRVGGDVIIPMSPCSQKSTQEPSRDNVVPQPEDEARRVEQEPPSDTAMLRFDGEARRVEAEPPRDTAMVQSNEEARSINQESLSHTAMPRCNEEARTVKHDSPSDSAPVQPNVEPANIKKDPPSNAATVQPNQEAIIVNQEPAGSASLLRPNEERGVENSKSVYEHKNQPSGDAPLETSKSFEDTPGMGSDHTPPAV